MNAEKKEPGILILSLIGLIPWLIPFVVYMFSPAWCLPFFNHPVFRAFALGLLVWQVVFMLAIWKNAPKILMAILVVTPSCLYLVFGPTFWNYCLQTWDNELNTMKTNTVQEQTKPVSGVEPTQK